MAKSDTRPICKCDAYSFPHRVGGKCTGAAFAEYNWYYLREYCDSCNCNADTHCDVVTGQESIKHGECYMLNNDRYLTIKWEE